VLELASYAPERLAFDPARVGGLATGDGRLRRPRASLVEPGQAVRITHVLDAVEPRVRPDGRAAFPGLTGPGQATGAGRVNALAGVLVVPTMAFPAASQPLHEQEGIVDMAGPGMDCSCCGGARVVVLEAEPGAGATPSGVDQAMRSWALRTAEALASPTLDLEPDDVEVFRLDPVASSLPRVAALVQLADLGELFRAYVEGRPAGQAELPRAVPPFAFLDGAVTNGDYHWAALANPTVAYQRNRLVMELARSHGRRLALAGVVALRGYHQRGQDKAAAAEEAAVGLGAEAVVITTEGGGNSHTDAMLTVRACERAGMASSVIAAEMADPDSAAPSLTDWVPEARSIVSAGNAEEVVGGWSPALVLGGDRFLDGRPATDDAPVPLRDYLGATCQLGDRYRMARTW
jgi:glycine reductase